MKVVILWSGLLLILFLPVRAQIVNIWALDDGEKVFREDLFHPYKQRNAIWDGKRIRLRGLFNEVIAFQIIAETGSREAENVELAIEFPMHKKSGRVIGGNSLTYGPDGTIVIYTEHYLHVTDSTSPNWYYGSPASRPQKMKGWIPDALIPLDAIEGKGGFPVDIGPKSNQGFWIDIYTPRDMQKYPEGDYEGKVQILCEGRIIKELPYVITLLPYYLPDENHTNVWLYTGDIKSYFPGMPEDVITKMIKFESHRHRVQAVGGFSVNNMPFCAESMTKYKPYLDGSGYTPANGYRGPCEGIGEKLFPVGMYGSPVLGSTRDTIQKEADKWVKWFEENAPGVKYFWYITDEPPENKYPWIKERSEWIKSNSGNGRKMPVFCTMAYQPVLDGVIDIWAGFDGVDLNSLPLVRRNGGDHWFYNGNRPRYGSIILEGEAVDMRVTSWILYKYGISTWFIWEGTHWKHNHQGPKGHLHQNVFSNPLTFINEHFEFGNGDGILFYPGRMPFYPEEDRGLNVLFPSIRLKNIRRGQQDVEIMWLVEQKIGREKVKDIISKVVPRALSEVAMTEPVPWSENGDDYEKIREELFDALIHGGN